MYRWRRGRRVGGEGWRWWRRRACEPWTVRGAGRTGRPLRRTGRGDGFGETMKGTERRIKHNVIDVMPERIGPRWNQGAGRPASACGSALTSAAVSDATADSSSAIVRDRVTLKSTAIFRSATTERRL